MEDLRVDAVEVVKVGDIANYSNLVAIQDLPSLEASPPL